MKLPVKMRPLTMAATAVFAFAALIFIWHPCVLWLRLWWNGAWILWPLFMFLSLATAISYMLPRGRAAAALHVIGEAAMSPVLLLGTLVFVGYIVKLFWREMPLEQAGRVILAVYILLLAVGAANALRVKLKKYEIKIGKPCPEIKIALISDLHLGAFTGKNMLARVVRTVEKASPDVIIIAGDLFDHRFSHLRRKDLAAAELSRLAAIAPVYACEGNHDLLEESALREEFIKSTGIKWLRDEAANELGADFVFRKDIRRGERLGEEELLRRADKERPVIAVDHNPSRYKALWEAGADLVLSGHTHGGQTFPGNLFYGLLTPHFYGLESRLAQHSIVTSGAGIYGTPARLGTPTEAVLITLKGK
ncbi:MAG: metallophosphoesterase [Oscillospiraceae bacterium]|nr:metallophosphoesterase [Oscillospiraceae bacterium]